MKMFIYIMKLISVLSSSLVYCMTVLCAIMLYHRVPSNILRCNPVQLLCSYQAWIILSVGCYDTGDSGMRVVRLVLWIQHGGEEGWRRRRRRAVVVFFSCLLQEHRRGLALLLPCCRSLCGPDYWWVHTITDFKLINHYLLSFMKYAYSLTTGAIFKC